MIEYLEDIEEPEEISEEGTEVREMYEHHRIEADKGQLPLRIDKFLMTRLPNASRTKIQEAADGRRFRRDIPQQRLDDRTGAGFHAGGRTRLAHFRHRDAVSGRPDRLCDPD